MTGNGTSAEERREYMRGWRADRQTEASKRRQSNLTGAYQDAMRDLVALHRRQFRNLYEKRCAERGEAAPEPSNAGRRARAAR